MNDPIGPLVELVRAHLPADASEADSVRKVIALLEAVPEPFRRTTLAGHITGSAMVLDGAGRALLLFHARLGIWVQPGGHVEEGDADVADGALREAREESGLADLSLERSEHGPLLLDVDVHPIPENVKRQEPRHLHHDLCFLARTSSAQTTRIDPEEAHDFRWVAASEVADLQIDVVTRRRLLKAFALVR